MEHHFNTEVAKKHGVFQAIFIHHIAYWILKNQTNGKNFIHGYYWTYNSTDAFSKQFGYFSQPQIKRIIKKLEEDKIVRSEVLNKIGYDRTKWYTIIDLDIVRIYQIHCTKSSNGLNGMNQPIPDSKPNSKPNNNKEDYSWYLKFINEVFKSKRKTFKKEKLIARLKTFSKDEIKRAILKASKSEYHIENGFMYLTPEYFTRNDENIDKWVNAPEPKQGLGELTLKEKLQDHAGK